VDCTEEALATPKELYTQGLARILGTPQVQEFLKPVVAVHVPYTATLRGTAAPWVPPNAGAQE